MHKEHEAFVFSSRNIPLKTSILYARCGSLCLSDHTLAQKLLGHKGHEEGTKHIKPFVFFTAKYSIKNIYS